MDKRLREYQRAEARRKEHVQSAEGRGERARSRSAFGGLSDTGAVELMRREFGTQLRPSVPDAETLLGGDRVAEFLSDYVARVEGSDGRPSRVIDSQVALRTPDSRELVDLDLERIDSTYAPDAGLADIALPAEVEKGLKAGRVRVTPGDADADAVKLDADTLAYPNATRATDIAVNATRTGFETFHQLRSPDSPETHRMDVELPPGSRLRATDKGGADVIDSSGDVKATVSAPSAFDAQGTSVPVSLDVENDVLELTARHRGETFAYPILVDPEFTVIDDWACAGSWNCTATWFHGNGAALDGLRHWEWWQDAPTNAYGPHKNCVNEWFFNNCYGPAHGGGSNWNIGCNGGRWSCGQTGLHINVHPNNWQGANTKIGEWVYKPPGSTTQIYRADFGAKFQRTRGTSNPVMFTGIYSYSDWNWVWGTSQAPGVQFHTGDFTHNWSANWGFHRPGPQAAAFAYTTNGAGPNSAWLDGYMGAAIMQLTDPEPPTITANTIEGPTGWSSDKWVRDGVFTIKPRATDPGLGVRRLRLTAPLRAGGNKTQDRGPYCNGTKGLACPSAFGLPDSFWNQSAFTVNATELPDGPVVLTTTASDALAGPGHDATATKTVKIDRSGPKLNLSGDLRAGENTWLQDEEHEVVVSAIDGTSAAPRSGVQRVEMLVDGSNISSKDTSSCPPDNCSLNHTFAYDTTGLRHGPHTVTIRATDRVGNKSEESWEILAEPKETIFELDPSATINEIDDARTSSGADLKELHHSGPSEGGYILHGDPPAEAYADYRESYQEDEGAGSEPAIIRFTLGGDVPTEALGSLGSKVTSRNVGDESAAPPDSASDEPESEILYPDELLQEDIEVEGAGSDTREDEAGASASAKKFAPSFGHIRTFNASGRQPRRIIQTLTFPKGSLDHFERSGALDHGYEHNLKFLDPNFSGSRRHPFCTNEKERFWLQRKGYSWRSTFPKAAHPYFDENVGDDCDELDFTVGLEYPRNVSERKPYSIRVRTRAGDRSRSPYILSAVKTFRFCSANPKSCSADTGSGAEGQLLVGKSKGDAPECRRWRKGHSSRRIYVC